MTLLPLSPVTALKTVELSLQDEPKVQRFFEANPEYFRAVQGGPATDIDAREEIAGELPPGLLYSKKWVIGYLDSEDRLAALANLLSDIFVPSVWNLSTFMVATSRYGSGDAQLLYGALEDWVKENGGQWLRLGVVKGYTRAERFWTSRGFVQAKERTGYQIGSQVNVLRVMVKPLAEGTLQDYLSLVPRDTPESS